MTTEDEIYCLIRKAKVKNLPEERVRQEILHLLTQELNFPLGGIAVEISLKQMPHLKLSSQKLPSRRADILCFHKSKPLLLVECKATPLNEKSLRQVIGYNWYVKAPFIALANQTELRFGYYDPNIKDFLFSSNIPLYKDIISLI